MQFSPDDIKTLWLRTGGVWNGTEGSCAQIAPKNLTVFCNELAAISRGEKSLHEIDPNDVKALYRRLQDLENDDVPSAALDRALTRVTDVLMVRLNRPDGDLVLSMHECEGESPTGDCIYDLNDEELSGEDTCIFCHQPNERK